MHLVRLVSDVAAFLSSHLDIVSSMVADEFIGDFGDKRLNGRCRIVATDRAATPGDSDSASARGDAGRQGAYRFMNHPKVTSESIVAAHRQATLARCAAAPRVLVIGDTTECEFLTRKATKGLGALSSAKAPGFYLHVTYAVTPEGVPLGILDAHYITRDPESLGRRRSELKYTAPAEDRESMKWSRSLDVAERLCDELPPGADVTVIFDREGANSDIIERATAEDAPYYVIIRARNDRHVVDAPDGECVHDGVLRMDPAERYVLNVPARPGRKARRAVLEARFAETTLDGVRRRVPGAPPKSKATTVTSIIAREIGAPADLPESELLDWRLFTTREVKTAADARRCVDDYSKRWCVEVLFKAFKSVQRALDRQYRKAKVLQASIAMDLVLAFLHLRVAARAREAPDAPATEIFSRDECRALWRFRGRPVPAEPKLKEVAREVALLGGYRGRRSDKPPGPLCFARGMAKLAIIVATIRSIEGKSPEPRADEASSLAADVDDD